MSLIQRYIPLLLLFLCSIVAFPQSGKSPLVIHIPYGESISQELIDSIYRQEDPYILSYHPKMAHLIPEMRCRRRFEPGKRIGVFSVAKDRQVSFSQGNLQYMRNREEWKFAENQWDYLCEKNLEGKHIDLLDWTKDASGCFLDWGQYEIQGDEVNTWRTLSIDEWKYLLHDRPRATELLGAATVNGVVGIVVLPDEWQLPEGMEFVTMSQEVYTWDDEVKKYNWDKSVFQHNIFTLSSWQLMEQAGAVFLPTSGYINGSGTLMSCGSVARMWSSTPHSYAKGYYISFGYTSSADCVIRTYSNVNSDKGHTVRLVHDTIVPLPVPCRTIDVNGVKFNMMCVEGGSFMMGAAADDADADADEKPQHQVTVSDFQISQTEVTQELWTAVMGTTLEEERAKGGGEKGVGTGDKLPMYCLSWYDCQAFVTKLNALTGLNFRLPTEAEWEFAARGGNKSRGFIYSGSNNPDEVAWHYNKTNGKVKEVGALKPNELGIYDMTGNVWEWVLDGYKEYSAYDNNNPIIPIKDQGVLRGASSASKWGGKSLRISKRLVYPLTGKQTRCGLRLVLSDEVKVKTIVVGDNAFNMIAVEGGTFKMGATDGDSNAGDNEFPVHDVTLSDYNISQIQVTQKLWTAVMGTTLDDELKRNNGETGLGKGDNLPMYGFTWFQAQEFAEKLSQLTGLNFRLPTEAEWEYAARGGRYTHGYKYAGSDNIDSVAWHHTPGGKVKDVAQLKPNELHLYDMSGNIWEWVMDGYAEYTDEPQVNPCVPRAEGGDVIHRGGSSYSGWGKHYNRVSFRYQLPPEKARTRVGLRLVMDNHQYVDLGLSVLWATCNVGASAPEEYGDYFAWGEVESKSEYTWENYKHGTTQNITKYNATDGLKTLLPEDDAAHVNWGGDWRMPSFEEQRELREYCTWQWTTVNGVLGYQVTSKINGNSIFLPAAGNITNQKLDAVGVMGYQWSSTVGHGISAHRMHFSKNTIEDYRNGGGSRACGVSVRPVIPTNRQLLPPITPTKRIGVFSVAKDRQVSFSQGNLQYIQSVNHWRFADNQYDYIGTDNVKDGVLADRIDLFSWSGKDSKAPWGISTSTNNADYAGEFVDWGTNVIQGDVANTWRTLSKDEWDYLIKGRTKANQLRSKCSINGVKGMLLLPDDWVSPDGVSIDLVLDADTLPSDVNAFSMDEWQRLELLGAVFLPAAGAFINPNVKHTNRFGGYCSSTKKNEDNSYILAFHVLPTSYTEYSNNRYGRSVRLVHDTIVPPPAPCETFEVSGVSFNMMCVEGGTFMMGAGKNEHQVTLSDYYIGETEVTQGMWRAVMGYVPEGQEYYGDEYPVAQVTLADCRRFVERLNQITGRHFRVPTEAEWEYAARGGRRSKGFLYAGSDSIGEVAWYKDNMTEYRPHPVAQLKPNELGTYDMTGNLAEWVSDWCAPYNLYPQINPTGAAVHSVVGRPVSYRGGCWTYEANHCLSTFRHSFKNRGANGIGFRLAMSDEEPFRAVYVNDTTRFYLRKVDGGTFMMGADESDVDAQKQEFPRHKVILDSYYIAETEITQNLWEAVMGTDIDYHRALSPQTSDYVVTRVSNHPMVYIYLADVLEFTRKLSQITGLKFRLPTEAEWEYAARGGQYSKGYKYPGSNTLDSVFDKERAAVAQFKPNELGIYDLAGNVIEMCMDYHNYDEQYSPEDQVNPLGRYIRQNGNRVYRGGSFRYRDSYARVSHRNPYTPTWNGDWMGARLVVNEEHHFQTFKVGGVWFDMIYVKGGTFQMGAAADDADVEADEKPQHSVALSDYYIGQLEVTQALWNAVMGSSKNPSTMKDNNLPVNNVSWDDCQLFIEKLNTMTGYKFRLPTEAEWEYAARGGHRSKGYKYSGSNDANEVAWYSANSGAKTHAFATKKPNELGIYDMSGNVWEWCQDWNGQYSTETQVNPQGPESGEYRMYRGGGFGYNAADCRVTRRRRTASYAKEALGLRLVLEAESKCKATMCGSATTTVTTTHPSCYEDGFIGGGIYRYRITTDYDGKAALYAGDIRQNGSSQLAVMHCDVTAGVPVEGIMQMPPSGAIRLAGSGDVCDFTRVFFRTYQNTSATIDYEFTLVGLDKDPLEGTAISNHAEISYYLQRVFGFVAGKTYTYELMPKYTGRLTLYATYSDSSHSTGSVEYIELRTLSAVEGELLTGTITIPTTESTTYSGMQPDCLIIRTHQPDITEVDYKFIAH